MRARGSTAPRTAFAARSSARRWRRAVPEVRLPLHRREAPVIDALTLATFSDAGKDVLGLFCSSGSSPGPGALVRRRCVPYVFPTRQIEGQTTPPSWAEEPSARAKAPANPALIIRSTQVRVLPGPCHDGRRATVPPTSALYAMRDERRRRVAISSALTSRRAPCRRRIPSDFGPAGQVRRAHGESARRIHD
jgi:hypothetical protein